MGKERAVKGRSEFAESEKPERIRATTAVQVDADLAQMIRTIASHDGISQADVVRPALKSYIPAQMARVNAEITANLKRQAEES